MNPRLGPAGRNPLLPPSIKQFYRLFFDTLAFLVLAGFPYVLSILYPLSTYPSIHISAYKKEIAHERGSAS